jgi:DegV family protein with EDD domain
MDMTKALTAGYERLAAWSELLDRINVFPVADGDTGRNLLISLAPLRDAGGPMSEIAERILFSARGNSGNIAARFFSGLLEADSRDSLSRCAARGRDAAVSAVDVPRPGTMLTFYDGLCALLSEGGDYSSLSWARGALERLEDTVRSTRELLPRLAEAGVVDAGALGMFLFFEGFFLTLAGADTAYSSPGERFGDSLSVAASFTETGESGYCLDMVVDVSRSDSDTVQRIAGLGESVVIIPGREYLKVHLHTEDRDAALGKIASMAGLVSWRSDDLGEQIRDFQAFKKTTAVHIVSDAAGSLTREDCLRYGFTLLDSYVLAGENCLPETLCPRQELYELMRSGLRVSTSQASDFERVQRYERLVSEHEWVLYLCVGSVFTGNCRAALEWKRVNDPHDRMRVIDTGVASGKLGLVVLATARYAARHDDPDGVEAFVLRALASCQEFLFLDRLHYLAAGGRMSRTGAFFGDFFNVKPVVSPFPDGARKVGIARSVHEQVRFALGKMRDSLDTNTSPLIMLQYTDNRQWVEAEARNAVAAMFPRAEIMVQPLSLTTGAHTGPGTWGVAFLPEEMRSPDL